VRVVIQRVNHCSVFIDDKLYSSIGYGILVLLAIEEEEKIEDLEWLVSKCLNLRIFADADKTMHRSVKDIHGEVMIISQFTLFASTKKGNRPSFTKSAKPEYAKKLVELFISTFRQNYGGKVEEGFFGADMSIELVNNGPVTIVIDTKIKE